MTTERRISPAPLTLEVIREISHLAAIKNEWSRLAESIAGITPFQLPEWQLTWWSHFGSGTLHVMVFRSVDTMVAILPCFLHNWNGRRQITLIGSGISDYLEPLIAAPYQLEVLKLLRGHLIANRQWDICEWQDLSAHTPLANFAPSDDFDVELLPDVECTEVPIAGSFEDYWAVRPHGLRRNVRRYGDKASLVAGPQFTVMAQADPEFMNALIRLHGERWQSRGELGMVAANGAAAFLGDLSREFDRADLLRIFGLRYQGRVAAVCLAFVYRNTVFSYLSAFDPEYGSFGFGSSLLYEAFKDTFAQGYRAWNFLRGNEPYKLLWGARSIAKSRLVITRKGQPGQ